MRQLVRRGAGWLMGIAMAGGAVGSTMLSGCPPPPPPASSCGDYPPLLSDLQDIVKSVDSIVSLIKTTTGTAPTTVHPTTTCSMQVEAKCGIQTDLTGLVTGSLSTIQGDLTDIDARATAMEGRPCSYDFELPVELPSLADASGKGAVDLSIGRTWDVKEARFLGGAAKLALALLDVLESHRVSLDIGSVGGASSPNGQVPALDANDLVNSLRSFGFVLWASPDLLTFAPANGTTADAIALLEQFPALATAAARELVRLLVDANGAPPGDGAVNKNRPAASTTDKGAFLQGAVFSWLDNNHDDQLDGGDAFHFGCWDNLNGKPCFSDPIAVPASVEASTISQVVAFLGELECTLGGACSGSAQKAIPLSDLNGILAAVGQKPLPGIARIAPMALFTNPKPLRSYLPIWLDDPCGNVWMQAEGEVPANTDPSILARIRNVSPTDSAHFPLPGTTFPTSPATFRYAGCRDAAAGSGQSLASLAFTPDGVFPDASTDPADLATTRNDTLVYLWFQDPSFNGAIQVCPGLLDRVAGLTQADWTALHDYSSDAASACTSEAQWTTPTADAAGNQLFNEALAWVLRDIARRGVAPGIGLPASP